MLSIGIDFGQIRDPTTIACVKSYNRAVASEAARRPRTQRHHVLTHLEKLPLGLSYPEQCDRLVALAVEWAGDERPTIWLDGTGSPVATDLFRPLSPFPTRVVKITMQGTVTSHGRDMSVGKPVLVGALESALSTRRAHAGPGLRHGAGKWGEHWESSVAADLDRELRAFGYSYTDSGNVKFEGKGAHDDLVIALALAIWGGERGGAGEAFLQHMRSDLAEPPMSA